MVHLETLSSHTGAVLGGCGEWLWHANLSDFLTDDMRTRTWMLIDFFLMLLLLSFILFLWGSTVLLQLVKIMSDSNELVQKWGLLFGLWYAIEGQVWTIMPFVWQSIMVKVCSDCHAISNPNATITLPISLVTPAQSQTWISSKVAQDCHSTPDPCVTTAMPP